MKRRYKISYFVEDQVEKNGFLDLDSPMTEICHSLPIAKRKAMKLSAFDVCGEVHIDEQIIDHGEWVFTENSWLAYSKTVVAA